MKGSSVQVRSSALSAVEEAILRAIADRSPVSLRYETTGTAPRTVHPHVLFLAANGEIYVDAYQVGGATSSGEEIPDWRQLSLAKVTAAELLDGSFKTAPGYNPAADKYAVGIIAQV
jgi:hypothetical protein